MKQRTKNPVDTALILGYIVEKNEREKLAGERAEIKAQMGGSISSRGVRRRR